MFPRKKYSELNYSSERNIEKMSKQEAMINVRGEIFREETSSRVIHESEKMLS